MKKMLVWGNPSDGFQYMGPFDESDYDAVASYTDNDLRDEYWWYVDVLPPEWNR